MPCIYFHCSFVDQSAWIMPKVSAWRWYMRQEEPWMSFIALIMQKWLHQKSIIYSILSICKLVFNDNYEGYPIMNLSINIYVMLFSIILALSVINNTFVMPYNLCIDLIFTVSLRFKRQSCISHIYKCIR